MNFTYFSQDDHIRVVFSRRDYVRILSHRTDNLDYLQSFERLDLTRSFCEKVNVHSCIRPFPVEVRTELADDLVSLSSEAFLTMVLDIVQLEYTAGLCREFSRNYDFSGNHRSGGSPVQIITVLLDLQKLFDAHFYIIAR